VLSCTALLWYSLLSLQVRLCSRRGRSRISRRGFPIGNGDFTVSGECAFDVQGTLLADHEFGMTFSNGATIITGQLIYKLTNETTGKSIVVNISGPGFFTDTAVLTGSSLLYGFPATPGLFLTRGPVTFPGDGSFSTTSAATVDLCAALS
jgi:hypothetical protein